MDFVLYVKMLCSPIWSVLSKNLSAIMKFKSEELNADPLLSLVGLPVKKLKITLGERWKKVVLQRS